MPLKVAPLEARDFDVLLTYKFEAGGDLAAPLTPRVWEVAEDDAVGHEARNRWSTKQQKEIFEDDKSCHYVKVIDTDNGDEMISLARWHYYENGFDPKTMSEWEMNGARGDSWPPGLNKELYYTALEPFISARPEWQGRMPMWVLTTLVTKTSQRKRGAGGMLLQWGIDQAKKNKVPAFLEASTAGAPLYKKFGFKAVGEQSVDLSKFGSAPLALTRMRLDP